MRRWLSSGAFLANLTSALLVRPIDVARSAKQATQALGKAQRDGELTEVDCDVQDQISDS